MGLWMAMATPEIDGHCTKETDQLEHLSFSWQNAKRPQMFQSTKDQQQIRVNYNNSLT